MAAGDHEVAKWSIDHWETVASPTFRADRPNFLIICEYGDWSGFRTLEKCLAQKMTLGKEKGFYKVVERF